MIIGNDRFHFFEILADASFEVFGIVITFSFFFPSLTMGFF